MLRNELSSHEKMQRNLKYILLSKRNLSKKATSCRISTMETLKRIRGCQGLGVREWEETNRQSTENLQRSENSLYDTIMMDICHYTLSEPIECTTPRVNPNVNCGVWVIMICQCKFTNRIKCFTLLQNVDNERGCACVGGQVYKKSLYILSFAVNLNLY